MLSILIVNWNVRDLLRDCLRSIARGRGGLEVEVIVVDGASVDGSAAMVAAEFAWVRLLPQAENVGFPRGNNIALAQAQMCIRDRRPGVRVVPKGNGRGREGGSHRL